LTIAISLKVHDGVVLAADSASTLFGRDPSGAPAVVNVYNTANKVFNLYKGLPIGAITWGAGSIGLASISTLVKDLRRRLMSQDSSHKDWAVGKETYTVESVAQAICHFFFEEQYDGAFKDFKEKPSLGFIVAGYSAGQDLPEEWHVETTAGVRPEPRILRQKEHMGISWRGEPEAITRLLRGYGTMLPRVLEELGVPPEQVQPAMTQIRARLEVPLAQPPMPIQDAIDLAMFLVDVAIKFSRFAPGAPTVGGPIEVAAITKHEGFKWVRRKFYYQAKYNP
jgi:hypothetical protein